ncbi:hypothetical protein V498_06667 [Pseudogymnoascus sp. VKM F-4517 (FW-2822)]|nr:hypothetical protein V498_06667 [Pseudogymnoascus sp. VKM F-4517 (FW-2822)]
MRMDPIHRLQESVIDGRTENVRYRQNQLQSLHAALCSSADLICNSIAEDTQIKSSDAEVETEYYLSTNAVKHFYEGLGFEKSISDEYLIATGFDNPQRKLGYGLVIIRPTTHTRLYSIVCPLAAALAAGNIVVIELPDTLLKVDATLKDILPAALDPDTFIISSKFIDDQSILSSSLLVDQTSASTTIIGNSLSSQNTDRTIAIVDRTADIDSAAKAVVSARFTFQGASPYSPDLVIVNEFVKDEFFATCSKYASQMFVSGGKARRSRNNSEAETRKSFEDAVTKGQLSTFGFADCVLADVTDSTCPLTEIKVHGCYLPIVTSTSMVDAIIKEMKSNLLAAYIFAQPPEAKFIAQHLKAHLTVVNQIPMNLLVGPAAPSGTAMEYRYRYSPDMFSIPRPQYISALPTELSVVDEHLVPGRRSNGTKKAKQLRPLATQKLPSTGQAQGFDIGFFEQGILLGLGVVFTIVVPATGWGLWVLGKRVRSMM